MVMHHPMEAYRGDGGKTLYIFNLGTGQRWVVSFMLWPLTSMGGEWVEARAGLNVEVPLVRIQVQSSGL